MLKYSKNVKIKYLKDIYSASWGPEDDGKTKLRFLGFNKNILCLNMQKN